ncbi:bifunctional 5,10-methylenetetrahydrofolate dehydrogenase/5,10-methenyltetrahydrofolate cyclohydrolase [Candidatus Kaiserbacteria bacterium]|nr:bifunctional 5,10-methylenetetrahydrofolate dehydrogenase/5,10-methenyltetrahydrofolate cyclohydrolase [Candidatus Kaiserbacteria bacterium]
MTINGKEIAESIYTDLAVRREGITHPLRLGIVVGTNDPVIESFVRIKTRAAARLGVEIVREELPEGAATASAVAALARLAAQVDGVIVQLPLPSQIDTDALLAAIPPEQDVDGISSAPRVRPPVAEAVAEIVRRERIRVQDMQAVVVGSGRLVGGPCAALLKELGAQVTVINKGEPLDPLKDAGIVVLGAGEPAFVKPDMLKDGVILIDAGTSEAGGKVIGDADPACADKAALFTPVPGGVGPIAVAMIFKNLFTLIEKQK